MTISIRDFEFIALVGTDTFISAARVVSSRIVIVSDAEEGYIWALSSKTEEDRSEQEDEERGSNTRSDLLFGAGALPSLQLGFRVGSDLQTIAPLSPKKIEQHIPIDTAQALKRRLRLRTRGMATRRRRHAAA